MNPLPHHFTENRPWGNFEQFTLNEPSTVKIITVNPGESLSLQKHSHRDENWKVISGDGSITLGEDTFPIQAGTIYSIPRNTLHRVSGGTSPVVFLEIALGTFDENDIERIEDKYHRS